MNKHDAVRYAKPIDEQEAGFRFILLDDPAEAIPHGTNEMPMVRVQLICDMVIRPIETRRLDEIETDERLTEQVHAELKELQLAEEMNRDIAIAKIRAELKARTGRAWSVTGGRGTAWGWITINSVPSKRKEYGYIADDDRDVLENKLGMKVHQQGISVPAGSDHYREILAIIRGQKVMVKGDRNWD